MKYCPKCNTMEIHDDSTYCSNCGFPFSRTMYGREKKKINYSNRNLISKKNVVIGVGVVLIGILVFSTISQTILTPLLGTKTIEKPVLESYHTLTPITEESAQDFDYFNNSLYFMQRNPLSIVKLTFNENQSNIISKETFPVLNNVNISTFSIIKKLTTNGNMFITLIQNIGNFFIYEIDKNQQSGQYTIANLLNITCNLTKNVSTAISNCYLTDIKLIDTSLYILESYQYGNQQANTLVEYNITTNQIMQLFELPNQKSHMLDVNEFDQYIGIDKGDQSGELNLNYENLQSIQEGNLGDSNYGFFNFNENTRASNNTIQYTIPGSVDYKISISNIQLSNMLYIKNKLFLFYYNETTGQLFKFATYNFETVPYNGNMTIEV